MSKEIKQESPDHIEGELEPSETPGIEPVYSVALVVMHNKDSGKNYVYYQDQLTAAQAAIVA